MTAARIAIAAAGWLVLGLINVAVIGWLDGYSNSDEVNDNTIALGLVGLLFSPLMFVLLMACLVYTLGRSRGEQP